MVDTHERRRNSTTTFSTSDMPEKLGENGFIEKLVSPLNFRRNIYSFCPPMP
jgi:hypothetical protein